MLVNKRKMPFEDASDGNDKSDKIRHILRIEITAQRHGETMSRKGSPCNIDGVARESKSPAAKSLKIGSDARFP